ncbi:MAG: SUMF1/EgtB/PvdO family nonheme iron enzyme [Acetobacteraceae bacterium]|nr:SUMF1/EgtB/PvdO family nonheme iron enzyme [Acetobacteraceae bacterium]
MQHSGARRLAAILSGDIAGYSRLMGADEKGTHIRVRRLMHELIEPTIAEHRRHLVKTTGDGFLVMFDSPVEAVRCGIVIQQNMVARNLELSKSQWIQFRIGINLGDVIVEPDDIFGEGVNVAVRLEQLAEPGGVYISGGIYEQIKYKLVCGYQSLGDRKVKNITDPVPIYRVLPDPSAVARANRQQAWRRMALMTAVLIVGATGGAWYFWRLHATGLRGTASPGLASGPAPEPVPPVAPRSAEPGQKTAERSPQPTGSEPSLQPSPEQGSATAGSQPATAPASSAPAEPISAPENRPSLATPGQAPVQAPAEQHAPSTGATSTPVPAPLPAAQKPTDQGLSQPAAPAEHPAAAKGSAGQPASAGVSPPPERNPTPQRGGAPSERGAIPANDPGERTAQRLEERTALLSPPFRPPAQAEKAAEPDMVWLKGGTFEMGSNEDPTEKPVHAVAIRPFWIAKAPVTVKEWRECVAANSCSYVAEGDGDRPVSNVSWDDALQFIAWLSQKTGKHYRLPTEAEWEYAARAGARTRYPWGDVIGTGLADCKGCGGPYDARSPMKVGSFPPNRFGLHDMAGGVAQFVSDCWHKDYHGAPNDGSSWDTPGCEYRVLRGGSWRDGPSVLRVSDREYYEADVRYPTHGFRVARSE